jgi:hypothetical protein
MNRSINLPLLVSLCCFVTLSFVINLSPDVPTSHASSILPEQNSTLSNSSASGFESNPITTIIIPNKISSIHANTSNNNVTKINEQSAPQSNSSSSIDQRLGLVGNQSDLASSNDTVIINVSSEVTNNDTLSDSQQRGKYLTDDNGIPYYNINNCSEKKGSSGIGNMSECEDAAKEMSEE